MKKVLANPAKSCQLVPVMNATPLDSYDNAIRTYGLDQAEYEELREMMNEASDAATDSFVSDSDNLGFLSDLFETYGFDSEQDSNRLMLRHSQLGDKYINIRCNNGLFTIGWAGDILSAPNETPQQSIGHILMICPWLDRDSVYEDAKLYGWGLPTYRDTFQDDE